MRDTDTDNHKEPTRTIKYIQDTIGLPLILLIKKSGNIKWYVHEEFVLHKDMRIHNGGFTNIGNEGDYLKSSKKLNTKSSTESELVGVDNVLAQVIWTQYFLKEQGYEIRDNVIYQDNQSSIKLENNGRR